MRINTQRFDRWIKKHKLLAMAAPLVLLLLVFFIVTSLKSMDAKDFQNIESGYNNSLPNQKNELEVEEPNTYYKQSVKDSLDRSREGGKIKNIVDSKKEKDSLEKILTELEKFSMDDGLQKPDIVSFAIDDKNLHSTPSSQLDDQSEAENKLQYRNMRLQARDERLARSQDYSAPHVEKQSTHPTSNIKFKASVYKDQFILPGDRVTLILKEEASLNGIVFPKNTFIYASSNIQGSRVLLDISNIDHVQISLMAKDLQDGNVGLYNQRAGQLWSAFTSNIKDDGIGVVSDELNDAVEMPLAKNMIRSFGSFFRKNRYKENDKILLMNGHNVYLVSKTQ